MCQHNLRCPDSNMYMKRRTQLRGSVPLSDRVVKLCEGHGRSEHRNISGRLKDGTRRTDFSKEYPVTFCERVAIDLDIFMEEVFVE